MGVRGLQSLLCGNTEHGTAGLPNGVRKINMRDEINKWKRVNGGKTPIIVIDAMGVIGLMNKKEGDLLCGGRHQEYYELFGNFFSELTACGAQLVFFSDLNVQDSKSEQWLARRDDEYDIDRQLFDGIAHGSSVAQLLRTRNNPKALTTARHALGSEGAKYGEYNHATKHDCDAELVKYARDHGAMAVIANDSDFLIFEGKWAYWSANDINVDTLETKEFNRKVLRDHLSLSDKQLPLFATLMGNDHTNCLFDVLREFHRRLGPLRMKWTNVAQYVRKSGASAFTLTESQIAEISARVFGSWDSMETREKIRNGIQSYNLDFAVSNETDPMLLRAVNHSDLYKQLTSPILTLTVTMYDMRDKSIVKSYTDIMAELLRKSVGLLWQQKDPEYSFKLFAKWSHQAKWSSKTERPIFPPENLNLPPLMQLLFEHDPEIDSALNAKRWAALLWLLSLPADCLERIKSVPMADRMVAVTLLFMVRQSQITASEADTILVVHAKVAKDQTSTYSCPTHLNARYVHVAHLYGKIFRKIRSAFNVTGLGVFVDKSFKFDGVAFHELRAKVTKNPNDSDHDMEEIKQNRIYID